MSFQDDNHRVEKCDFSYQVDCTTRPELQPAQASENCPRANGYFPHAELGRCGEYYYCAEGSGYHNTCPESLVFSPKSGTCVCPDECQFFYVCINGKTPRRNGCTFGEVFSTELS